MAQIISLVEKVTQVDEPHPGVIEALETVLARAKAGEVQGFRIVCCNSDGTTCGTIVGYCSYAMLGMMYSLTAGVAAELEEAETIADAGA